MVIHCEFRVIRQTHTQVAGLQLYSSDLKVEETTVQIASKMERAPPVPCSSSPEESIPAPSTAAPSAPLIHVQASQPIPPNEPAADQGFVQHQHQSPQNSRLAANQTSGQSQNQSAHSPSQAAGQRLVQYQNPQSQNASHAQNLAAYQALHRNSSYEGSQQLSPHQNSPLPHASTAVIQGYGPRQNSPPNASLPANQGFAPYQNSLHQNTGNTDSQAVPPCQGSSSPNLRNAGQPSFVPRQSRLAPNIGLPDTQGAIPDQKPLPPNVDNAGNQDYVLHQGSSPSDPNNTGRPESVPRRSSQPSNPRRLVIEGFGRYGSHRPPNAGNADAQQPNARHSAVPSNTSHSVSQGSIPDQKTLSPNTGSPPSQGSPQYQNQQSPGVHDGRRASGSRASPGTSYTARQVSAKHQAPLSPDAGQVANQGSVQYQAPPTLETGFAASQRFIPYQSVVPLNVGPAVTSQNVSSAADQGIPNSQKAPTPYKNSISSQGLSHNENPNPQRRDAKLPIGQGNPSLPRAPLEKSNLSAVKSVASQIKGFDQEKKNRLISVLEKAKKKKELETAKSKQAELSKTSVVGRPQQSPDMQRTDVIAETKSSVNLIRGPQTHREVPDGQATLRSVVETVNPVIKEAPAPSGQDLGNPESQLASEEKLEVSPKHQIDVGVVAEPQSTAPLPTKRQLSEQNIFSSDPLDSSTSHPPRISLLSPSPPSPQPPTKPSDGINPSSPASSPPSVELIQESLGELPAVEVEQSSVIRLISPDLQGKTGRPLPPRGHAFPRRADIDDLSLPSVKPTQKDLDRSSPPAEGRPETSGGRIPEVNSPAPQNGSGGVGNYEGVLHDVVGQPAVEQAAEMKKKKGKGRREEGRKRARSPEKHAGAEELDDRYDWYQVDVGAVMGRACPPRPPLKLLQGARLGGTNPSRPPTGGWLGFMKEKTVVFADSEDTVGSLLTGDVPGLPPTMSTQKSQYTAAAAANNSSSLTKAYPQPGENVCPNGRSCPFFEFHDERAKGVEMATQLLPTEDEQFSFCPWLPEDFFGDGGYISNPPSPIQPTNDGEDEEDSGGRARKRARLAEDESVNRGEGGEGKKEEDGEEGEGEDKEGGKGKE
ncbi:hypothetical protein TWF506_003245 [Arthrobotrys conoides]|uniref:Uncharacterized protein n=1 Tax=Arthrobotrys conoides TaxID=74498 RepID=A0AAN8N539_9PEZI